MISAEHAARERATDVALESGRQPLVELTSALRQHSVQVAEQRRWVAVGRDLAAANPTPRSLVVAPDSAVCLMKRSVEYCALVGAQAALADEEIEQPEQRGNSLRKRVFLVPE